jgi:hypothetical protein
MYGTLSSDFHRCRATFLQVVTVDDEWPHVENWSKEVAVFTLEGNFSARMAYAWSFREEHGTRYIAVAGIPSTSSPEVAVQAAKNLVATGV